MGRFAFVHLALLLVALPLSATGAPNSCPYGWLTYNNSCYKIFRKFKTWNNAEMFCVDQEMGCHLASIHDAAESLQLANYVSQFLTFINVWIGLRDPKRERVWQWSDGSRTNYTPWEQGEPNNLWYNEYCVELWSRSGYIYWNDESCSSLRAFLCKCLLQP
uniref:Lectin-Mor-1 n=1 Tax=Morelia spilota TaxID=51896 RepID=M9T7C0_MORSI|nr:lectin-Mor-1 [Morelia spilota]